MGGGEEAKITKQLKQRPEAGSVNSNLLLTVWRASNEMSFHLMIDERHAAAPMDSPEEIKYHNDFCVTVIFG